MSLGKLFKIKLLAWLIIKALKEVDERDLGVEFALELIESAEKVFGDRIFMIEEYLAKVLFDCIRGVIRYDREYVRILKEEVDRAEKELQSKT